MSEIAAYNYPDVYSELGIDIQDLGCVMLDLNPIPVLELARKAGLSGDDLFFAKDERLDWVRGPAGEDQPHLTLLYGLLFGKDEEWGHFVECVLHGWGLQEVEFERIDIFPSEADGVPYEAVVAAVRADEKLLEGHHRLQLLPHIKTFPNYRPHVTLAFVREGRGALWADAMKPLIGSTLPVFKINTGDEK